MPERSLGGGNFNSGLGSSSKSNSSSSRPSSGNSGSRPSSGNSGSRPTQNMQRPSNVSVVRQGSTAPRDGQRQLALARPSAAERSLTPTRPASMSPSSMIRNDGSGKSDRGGSNPQPQRSGVQFTGGNSVVRQGVTPQRGVSVVERSPSGGMQRLQALRQVGAPGIQSAIAGDRPTRPFGRNPSVLSEDGAEGYSLIGRGPTQNVGRILGDTRQAPTQIAKIQDRVPSRGPLRGVSTEGRAPAPIAEGNRQQGFAGMRPTAPAPRQIAQTPTINQSPMRGQGAPGVGPTSFPSARPTQAQLAAARRDADNMSMEIYNRGQMAINDDTPIEIGGREYNPNGTPVDGRVRGEDVSLVNPTSGIANDDNSSDIYGGQSINPSIADRIVIDAPGSAGVRSVVGQGLNLAANAHPITRLFNNYDFGPSTGNSNNPMDGSQRDGSRIDDRAAYLFGDALRPDVPTATPTTPPTTPSAATQSALSRVFRPLQDYYTYGYGPEAQMFTNNNIA